MAEMVAELDKISIHAPLAGRDYAVQSISPTYFTISIHAPLAGRDLSAALLFSGV